MIVAAGSFFVLFYQSHTYLYTVMPPLTPALPRPDGGASAPGYLTYEAPAVKGDLNKNGMLDKEVLDMLARHIMNRKKDVPKGYDLAGDRKADIKDVIWLKVRIR